MHPTLFMLQTLAIGTIVLMLGILACKESGQSFKSACKECLGWGAGFFLSMSVQIAVFAGH